MCIFVGLTDFAKCGVLILVDEIPHYRNYHCHYCYYYYYCYYVSPRNTCHLHFKPTPGVHGTAHAYTYHYFTTTRVPITWTVFTVFTVFTVHLPLDAEFPFAGAFTFAGSYMEGKAVITSGFRIGRSEVLRISRHYGCRHKARGITP